MTQLDIFGKIKHFIFDVDGVLTDGKLLIQENGDLLRMMHVHDGLAMKKAINCGFEIAIITGGNSTGVTKRLQGLGIENIYTQCHDKLTAFRELVELKQWNAEEILYMGDDLPDFEVLKRVGMSTCPADAVPEIKNIVQYVSNKKGGDGCIRDVIERVMKLQNKWTV